MKKRLWEVGVMSVSTLASVVSIVTTDTLLQTFACHFGVCIRLPTDAAREREMTDTFPELLEKVAALMKITIRMIVRHS